MSVSQPANETERLQALRRYAVLDTPPEPAFDRITSLAARLFDVPTVLIALVDDSRAWFKSCYGFDQREVRRNDRVCNFAVLHDRVLVILDAQQDEQLACNPLMQHEPGLRFYAGAPLLTQDGFNLGTLCLLDTKPHASFTPEQEATLVDLVAIVMDELELRLSVHQLAEIDYWRQNALDQLQLYANVVHNTQVGLVVWQLEDQDDPASFRLLIANPAASAITGCNFEVMIGKTMAESFPALLQTSLVQRYLEVVRTERSLDLGEVPCSGDSTPTGIYSLKAFSLPRNCLGLAFENITARKQIETQLKESQRFNQQITETLPGVMFVHDLIHHQSIYTNRQIADLLGYTPEQVQAMGSRVVETLIHPEDMEQVLTYLNSFRTASDDTVIGIEYRAHHADGAWRWLYTQGVVFARTPDGVPCQMLGISVDISDRKQSEQALQESEAWTRLATQVAQLGAWRLHLDTDLVEMDQRMRQIWGEPEDASLIPLPVVLRRLHPEDRDRVAHAVNAALAPASAGHYEIEYRIIWNDGAVRWVLAKGQAQFMGEGANRRAVDFFGTLLDITDRKQAETNLQESEARLTMALRSAQAGMWQWFKADNRTIWSEENFQLLGYEPGQCPTTYESWIWAVHPEDRDRAEQAVQQALDNDAPLYFEYRVCLPDGSVRWLADIGQVTYDDQGNQEGMIGIQIDISGRKQIELERERSEERLSLALQAANQGLYDLNVQTGEAIVTPEYARMLGYEPEAFQETNARWRDRLHPDDVAMVYRTYEEYIAGMSPEYRVEFRQRTQDGNWVWILSIGKIVAWDREGQPLRMLGTHTDISDRKRSEQALQEHSERLNLLYETTRDLLSNHQPLELMNRLFHRLQPQMDLHYYYHFQLQEQDGRRVLRLKNYSGISEEQARILQMIEVGQSLCGLVAQIGRQIVLNRAEIATHPNARMIDDMGVTAYAGQPLMVHGRLLGTLSFASLTRSHFTAEEINLLQAISEQVAIALDRAELVASLQQQTEDLARVNRVKDEFLAVLSHELRSPLNPILGWTKLLQTGKFDAQKTRQALDAIERNAKQQTQLIDDLLDISRILRGKMVLSEAPVDLAFIIEAALETTRLAAEARDIQIITTLNRGLPPVLGDAGRLQQIISNLLSNAIKFTPSGGRVVVRLEQGRDDTGEARTALPYAQITVSDTGKGISPDFLPYVFESFRQEDSRTTRKFGGLGLGLAIVRQLTELHGGTVHAVSPGEGKGATFTVYLPLMKTQNRSVAFMEPVERSTEPPQVLQDVRVLVVDDEEDMRDLVVTILTQAGATVQVATSASEALVIVDWFDPMVIVSDIGMPEVDGYDFMRQVRSRAQRSNAAGDRVEPRIPIGIALTAYAMEPDQQRAMAAGFQRHLAKPIEPDGLVQAIAALVHGQPLS